MSVTLHTNYGDIKLELYCESVPKSCQNFLALCASGYYNENAWHRNIKGFMIQTGDPTGTGKGGESIYGGKFEDELRVELKHDERGVVSMANNGPDTNGSQFFITYAAHPHLDLKYTVFGRVIDGWDTLDELEKQPVNAKHRPLGDLRIRNVTIHANPIADAADASRGEEYVLTDDYGLGGVPFDQDDIHVNRELFPISLERPAGPDVIPLADICKLLKAENASDVCVIAVPPDASYCDYMVIASMISTKHVSAVASKTRKIYRRRMQPGDMSIGYEGHFAASKIFNTMRKQQHRNNDWVALDMGRIVLHLMLPETRCKMDLESLWLLGAEHDDHTQAANNMEQIVDDVEKEQPVDWDSYYMADNAEKEKQKQLYAQWLKQQQ